MTSILGRTCRRFIRLFRGWKFLRHSGIKSKGSRPLIGPRFILDIGPGGMLTVGANCSFYRDVEIVVYAGGQLELGDHVYVGHGTTIACAERIHIGSNTLVGDLVSIRDMNHRRAEGVPLRLSGIETRPVRIGSNCWLGSKVTFAAGAEVGDDVTVAANAVVTRKFASGLVIAGVPAKLVRLSRDEVEA